MIQLIIDYVTNKILGYNTVIPENTRDLILVEEEELSKFHGFSMFDNLYYENGKIIEKEAMDSFYKEMMEIEKNGEEFRNKVNNEQKIFMDHILSGKTFEEAASVIKNNRERLEMIEDQRKILFQGHENRKSKAVLAKFKEEEEEISHKYFLSVITAVRNEENYIEEWLNYHIENIGVEHFYLYDNESELSLKTYLEDVNYKYLDKITIIDWETSQHTQQDTCNHWLENYGCETKWFICMDVDEFIQIKEEYRKKTLHEFLSENTEYSRIKCLWKHYTANGKVKKSGEPVMNRFTEETQWGNQKHGGKYFAQSNRVSHFITYVPQVRLNSGRLEHDSESVNGFYQLNHYITKSYEEWLEKIARGSVNPGYMRKYQEFFEINPDMQYLNTGEKTAQGYGAVNK